MRPASLRRRLMLHYAVLALAFAVALFGAVRLAAERASRAGQDAILGAALVALADAIRPQDKGLELNLPYASFSMLGAMGDERVFYRVTLDDQPVTGYNDLPGPPAAPGALTPVLYTADYRDTRLRLAALSRVMLVDDRRQRLSVVLGQTRYGQAALARHTAWVAAGMALGFLALALPLLLWAARVALRPVEALTGALARRGPGDLSPLRSPPVRELRPLVGALNGLMARLRGTLGLAESFIFEAAHRIRTPLSLVRTEAEITLRQTDDTATRDRLRRMLRAIEDSSRSASQILDHAMVLYRTDQWAPAPVDLARITAAVVQAMAPVADMRDISLRLTGADGPLMIPGDGRLIEVALRNLIDNAVKYSPPEATVTVALTRKAGHACVTITDQGRGLAGDDLAGRFTRGSNVGDVVGSGLGLTIVAEAARAHHGRLTLTPNPSEGTCATLSLPL